MKRHSSLPFTPPAWSHTLTALAYAPYWRGRSPFAKTRFFHECELYDRYLDLPPHLRKTFLAITDTMSEEYGHHERGVATSPQVAQAEDDGDILRARHD